MERRGAYLFIKHHATHKGADLLWGHVVKNIVEHHLGANQLISRRDLTGDSALDFDNVGLCNVTETTQNGERLKEKLGK